MATLTMVEQEYGVQRSMKGSATVGRTRVSKVARVVSLNRKHLSKIFMPPKGARDTVGKISSLSFIREVCTSTKAFFMVDYLVAIGVL